METSGNDGGRVKLKVDRERGVILILTSGGRQATVEAEELQRQVVITFFNVTGHSTLCPESSMRANGQTAHGTDVQM